MPSRRPLSSRNPCRAWPAGLAAVLLAAGVAASSARAQTAPAEAEAAEAAPATTAAVRDGAAVNQALDQNVDLDQQSRPLAEVLDVLRQKSGINFVVPDDTYARLPYGRDTPITASVKGTPLRRSLEAITSKLGLGFALRGDAVEIRPLPALRRNGRRATIQEIAGLDLLSNVRLDTLEDRQPASALLESIDLRLDQVDSEAKANNKPEPGYRVENRLGDALRDAAVSVPRNATLLGALDAVAEQTGATWYPWGGGFVVLPKTEWVRRQLEESELTKEYDGATPQQVLDDLQRASGVAFSVEPGALQRVAEPSRAVRLSLKDASVREALERLSAATGLGYVVDDSGVYLWNQDPRNPNAARRGGAGEEQPVLLVPLADGTSMLLYPSDLSDELRTQLAGRRKEAVASLVAALAAGDPPAPEPTTRPTE